MFMVTASFGKRCKSIYLPDASAWNNTWSFTQNDTGLSSDFSVSIRALDGQWYLGAPKGWKWSSLESGMAVEGEVQIDGGEHAHYMLYKDDFTFGFVVSEYQKEDTRLVKYRIAGTRVLEIGRNDNCEIRVDDKSISDRHASLVCRHGEVIFEDHSSNGSYVNGKLVHNESRTCKFGDNIFVLPNLRMIYLDDMLAISSPASLKHVDLGKSVDEASARETETEIMESPVVEFLRSPRIMDQPDVTPFEIEPPISKGDPKHTPLILTIGPSLTMIFPMLMGSFMTQMGGSNGGSFMGSGIAMMGTSAALAVGWALANARYRKNQEKGNEKKRVHLYTTYIKDREQRLRALNEKEFKRLTRMYVDSEECLSIVSRQSDRLWERQPTHSDFLDVRIGTSEVDLPNPLKVPAMKLSMIDDPMRNEPERLKKQYGKVKDAPVCIPLRKEKLMGLMGNTSATAAAFSMIINITAMHSYHNVKVVVLTDEQHYSQWRWTRWLPHVYANENRSMRLVAATAHARSEVLQHLDEVLGMRLSADNEDDKNAKAAPEELDPRELPLPHYVVFCTDPAMLKDEPVLRKVITSRHAGVTLLCLTPTLNELPKECTSILNCRNNSSGLYNVNGTVTPAQIDYTYLPAANDYAKKISAIRTNDGDGGAAIPTLVKFLSMYHSRKVDELDVWRWWNENHVYNGLPAVIGLKAGGVPFMLDISEKHHGPHGLVAGTTGSGKSVMLQSYILSLALNFSPVEVQFILIDYKGGGMAAPFMDLPHVAGVIDNLQGLLTIRRALASIQGEIKRREQLFKEAKVEKIDEYIRYFNDQPGQVQLGHLIIVVDEFAELVHEQPEFMKELISASRVGRSVGVHLILATQKPSNSVNDEIWANSRFHICLRVQSRSDSMDMLKRPDAAYLRGMGRCFVQVGNDELFETVQTSWSTAPYEPDKVDFDDKPYLLNDVGQPIVIRSQKKKVEGGIKPPTQMKAILDYIRQVADTHGVPNARKLWLEELPKLINLSSIAEYKQRRMIANRWQEPDDEQLCVTVGLADDLQKQLHIPVQIDFTAHKNHLIVGLSGTGKTTLLQTLAMALATTYSPERLNMYFISPSTRVLSSLELLPHTAEMLYEDDTEEMLRLLNMLRNESNRRRSLFAEASTDNFTVYNKTVRQTGVGEAVPAIVVFIDRFIQLDETLNESNKQFFYDLLKDGSSRGIYFVATAIAVNEVYSRVRDYFYNVALQLQDRGDYTDVLGKRLPSEMNDIVPCPGRGVVLTESDMYEMQIALFEGIESDTERSKQIQETAQALDAAWTGKRPARIPRIPENPTLNDLLKAAQEQGADKTAQLPIGYLKLEGTPYQAELIRQYAWLILGSRRSGKTTFLQNVARQFVARDADIHVIGDSQWNAFVRANSLQSHDVADATDLALFLKSLHSEISSRNAQRKKLATDEERRELFRDFRPMVILIDNLEQLLSRLNDNQTGLLVRCCNAAAEYGIYFFATLNTKLISQVRTNAALQAFASTGNGLSLCGKLNEADVWDIQLTYALKSAVLPVGQAYMVNGNKVRGIVLPN